MVCHNETNFDSLDDCRHKRPVVFCLLATVSGLTVQNSIKFYEFQDLTADKILHSCDDRLYNHDVIAKIKATLPLLH